MLELDLLVKDACGLNEIPIIEEVPQDEIHKLFQDGEDAAALGGFATLSKLRAETAHVDQNFSKISHGPSPHAPAAPARRNTVDGTLLHKTVIATGAISEWLEKQVALGKTTREAIAEWKVQFPNHSREVLAEIEKAAAGIDAA